MADSPPALSRRIALLASLAISIDACKPRSKREVATGEREPEAASGSASTRGLVASTALERPAPSTPSASEPKPTVLQELDVPVGASAAPEPAAGVEAFLQETPDGPWLDELPADLGPASESAPLVQAPLPGLVDWVDAEGFRIPSPGWRVFKRTEKGLFLAAPDGKGDMVVQLFREPKEIHTLLASSRVHDWRFQPPVARTVGPEALPALIGHGRAKSALNKDVIVLYGLVRGEPDQLAVVCTVLRGTGTADLATAFAVMTNVKRHK